MTQGAAHWHNLLHATLLRVRAFQPAMSHGQLLVPPGLASHATVFSSFSTAVGSFPSPGLARALCFAGFPGDWLHVVAVVDTASFPLVSKSAWVSSLIIPLLGTDMAGRARSWSKRKWRHWRINSTGSCRLGWGTGRALEMHAC